MALVPEVPASQYHSPRHHPREPVLFASPVPLCHMPDSALVIPKDQKTLIFHFTADPAIFGDEFKHLGRQRVEWNVWEAGGDPGDIILGLSFSAGNRSLLNTLHVAYADKEGVFDQAEGLRSRTSPFEPVPVAPPLRRRTEGRSRGPMANGRRPSQPISVSSGP
jgi:hypothetical protein